MALPIKLYNTRTRSVEEFVPLNSPNVGFYSCGPTVYSFQHLGNLRRYLLDDTLVRTLRRFGYTVNYVMNVTDVGHLVSDADEGDDKMLIAMRREGKTAADIASFYTRIFFDHRALLNIVTPNVVCPATEHITQMLALIEKLIALGHAYVASGNIYFDVSSFPSYGKFANLKLDAEKAGTRVDVDSGKRHPSDFVLWFTRSKFENHELLWDSPWGRGYPGWHIECSAMAMHYLGEQIDIHAGGTDHITVHHTNEIAQSEGATGKRFANYWLHSAWLTDGGAKLAKSTGGALLLSDIVDKGFDPIAFRLFCLGASYRSELRWGWEALEGAANTLTRLRRSVESLRGKEETSPSDYKSDPIVIGFIERFNRALSEDLSTPQAVSILHEVLSLEEIPPAKRLLLAEDFDEILGLGIASWQTEQLVIPETASQLLALRSAARESKNWSESDRIRDELLALGFEVVDSKSGSTLRKR